MPNIAIQEPIEVEGLALVPTGDERVRALATKHRRFSAYLQRFKTEFGIPVSPTLLIRESTSPERYRSVEALAAFRDSLALSVIPHSWAQALRFESTFGIRYANWFSFYPWMVDAKYEGVIMQSMAQLGYHEVEALNAQVTPGISHMALDRRMIDRPLLDSLLRRWQKHFGTDSPSHENVALFRSLNMALSASMLPGNVEVTIYDIGRAVALWVSAFEILAHPGNSGVEFKQVYEMLERPQWNLSDCRAAIYKPHRWKEGQPKRSLPVWLYGELYRARNDFLHGNPIGGERLIVPPAKRPLHLYTAVLFRMALTAHLDLKLDSLPARASEADLPYIHFSEGFQRDIEVALATILRTEDEYRAERLGLGRRRPGRQGA